MTTFRYPFGVFSGLDRRPLEKLVRLNGVTIEHELYGYALNGERQSTLGYDEATGRISTMLAAGSTNAFSWSYLDGTDLKSSLAYPNGLTASWSYDADENLLQVCNATATNVISQYDYIYDAAGRRIGCDRSGTVFDEEDTINYRYNDRGELTNAVSSVDSAYDFSYAYDDIGNRMTAAERGTNYLYVANELNQYMAITNLQLSTANFQPEFDDDGNVMRVKTSTDVWQIAYNGENRPIMWTSGTNFIAMSFDRMGRRVIKNAERFIYDGYLQIADCSGNAYAWDPSESVATCPIVWQRGEIVAYFTHDGNKNVSEVVAADGTLDAHYKYAPFGEMTARHGEFAAMNSWRFSSEFADDETAMMYYNYRHYDPMTGRWIQRDPLEEEGGANGYSLCLNNTVLYFDVRGMYGSSLPGILQSGYCEKAYNYALEHLHTSQERAAWERYTNHGWRGKDRNIKLSPEDVRYIATSINDVSEYIRNKRELCKNGGKFEVSTSIGGNAPAPWDLAIGGVSINVKVACDNGCFSYCFSINDLYDFDIKGIPGFTSRSAKGEIVTWLVITTETCLQCDWTPFYHVGSFCGKD